MAQIDSNLINNMDEKALTEKITKLVIQELSKLQETHDTPISGTRHTSFIHEKGTAVKGNNPDEVVVALGPSFGTAQTETINGLSHERVIQEIAAGIEEEGLRPRFIKVYDTSDVSFISHKAAKYSGSGIGIGIQSKGTVVIHQKDLFPLTNLELFPQAPIITLELYRRIGKNAAKYAKGQSPVPIETENDYMIRPKFQAKAAVLHIKETGFVREDAEPVELEVTLP